MNLDEQRLKVLKPDEDDDTCLTFVLKGEDHTLGNVLRYIIMQNPQVKFCAYAIPNPSENLINLRIETYGAPPGDIFRKGLEDLQEICNHVTKTFKEARDHYNTVEQVSRNVEAMHTDD